MSSYKYKLDFISDNDIFNHVRDTIDLYRSSINFKNFTKNLLDPIKLTFDSKVYRKNIIELIEEEVLRQVDKTNNNHIGYFHQNIFKYFIESSWEVPKKGFDIINLQKKIFVEIKNKHNTMNSSSSAKTYTRMQAQLIKDPESICMLVEVIAKKSQNISWKVTIDDYVFKNEKIRRVSIDQFYEIVTKEKKSFSKLCFALPQIIEDVLLEMPRNVLDNTVLQEIKNLYGDEKDLIFSLFLLTFKTYYGFNSN